MTHPDGRVESFEPTYEPLSNILDRSLVSEFEERARRGRKTRGQRITAGATSTKEDAAADQTRATATATAKPATKTTAVAPAAPPTTVATPVTRSTPTRSPPTCVISIDEDHEAAPPATAARAAESIVGASTIDLTAPSPIPYNAAGVGVIDEDSPDLAPEPTHTQDHALVASATAQPSDSILTSDQPNASGQTDSTIGSSEMDCSASVDPATATSATTEFASNPNSTPIDGDADNLSACVAPMTPIDEDIVNQMMQVNRTMAAHHHATCVPLLLTLFSFACLCMC